MGLTLFHGTLSIFKDKILKNGFTISTGSHHYLGDGVYFYPELESARKWGAKKADKTKNGCCVVFRSQVIYSKCLDLTNGRKRDDFVKYCEEIDRHFESSGKVIKLNGKTNEDCCRARSCACINTFCSGKNIDIVKAFVLREMSNHRVQHTNSYLSNLGISPFQEIQYCVRNLRCIKTRELFFEQEEYV